MRNGSRVRARDEGGAVAVLLALVTCLVFVPLAALVVDIGLQRVVVRDLQSLADVVALDLARKLDTSTTVAQWASRSPSLQEHADDTVERNQTLAGSSARAVPVLGKLDAAGEFVELPAGSTEVPAAIKVTTTGTVDFTFNDGSGGGQRTAIAMAETAACFQLGSWAASLDPSASPLLRDLLTPLIGSSTLQAAGYQGLATARISLLELVRTPYIGVGTVDQLLALDDLTVADLYRASAQVLRANGKAAEANVFDVAATSVVAAFTIKAGDLIGLGTAPDSVLAAQVNALDLLLGTAFLANGENLLNVDNLQTSLSSVGVTATQLRIIERAQRACNDDVAETAQVRFSSVAKLTIASSPLYNQSGSIIRLIDNKIMLNLDAQLAGATGRLLGATCQPDTFDVEVTTEMIRLNLEGRAYLEGTVRVQLSLLSVVDIPVRFEVVARSAASRPAGSPTTAHLALPPMTYDQHVEVGSGPYALPNLTFALDPASVQVDASVLGLLNLSLSSATTLVTPTLQQVAVTLGNRAAVDGNALVTKVNTILSQLSTALGLNVAGADVYALPYPNCQTPVLRG